VGGSIASGRPVPGAFLLNSSAEQARQAPQQAKTIRFCFLGQKVPYSFPRGQDGHDLTPLTGDFYRYFAGGRAPVPAPIMPSPLKKRPIEGQ